MSASRQKPPVAKPLDKTSDLVRKGQNLPANVWRTASNCDRSARLF